MNELIKQIESQQFRNDDGLLTQCGQWRALKLRIAQVEELQEKPIPYDELDGE